jgi:oxalate decarboxylase
MTRGSCRITTLSRTGEPSVDDVQEGDLWYFPPGLPHSLQGLGPDGAEFVLAFDDGAQSESNTLLLTDWFAHTPPEVLAKNFGVAQEVFRDIPLHNLWIFPGDVPGDLESDRAAAGVQPDSEAVIFRLSRSAPVHQNSGGRIQIADSSNFPASKTVAAALTTVEPGSMRELHWHPNADEWSFFIRGRARVTIFAAEGTARTFNYVPGDVGIVPANHGHFVENIGDEPIEMLEVFRADEFRDFSLFQWLGESPQRMVLDTLFDGDKENGDKFWNKIKGAEKPVVTKP